jgi:tetratricopeptide (TPR) repeat protein
MLTCEEVRERDLPERYVRGELDEEEARSYEEHYFSCSECFEELQLLRKVQEGLRDAGPELESLPDRRSWLTWTLMAAALIVAGGVAAWLGLGPREAADPPVALAHLGTEERATIEAFARIEPASYAPLRLRSAETDASRAFREAMQHYAAGDYDGALPGLIEARRLDPTAADIAFYLGVTQLVTGDDAVGVETLRRTVALGDTPFLEDSLLYLARAALKSGDPDAAREHLARVVALDGDRKEVATRHLEILERLPHGP